MRILIMLMVLGLNASLWANENSPTDQSAALQTLTFQNTSQEQQYRRLIEEFRCPKCQNANLAGSDAPIAQDLKLKTYELVKAGQTDDQIHQYMMTRYGTFISYKPPIQPATWVLWFAPPLVLLLGLFFWWLRTHQQRVIHTAPLSAEESWRLNQLLNQSSNQSLNHNADKGQDQERRS